MAPPDFHEGTGNTSQVPPQRASQEVCGRDAPWALGRPYRKEGPPDRKPRVLVIGNVEQLARRMDKNAWHRYEALRRHENVTLTGPGCSGFVSGMPVRHLFRRFGRPDFIIHGLDLHVTGVPLVEGLADVDIPKAMELEDTWEDPPRQQQFLRDLRFDYAFHTTRAREEDYERNCPSVRMIWTPFAVRTDVFRDYGLAKENDLLLYGRLSARYPLRERLRGLLERLAASATFRVKIIAHPGWWDDGYVPQEGHYVGAKLAREINRSWIGIATGSVFDCLFAKHLEIAASRSLVAGSLPVEARPFLGRGFVDLCEKDDDEIVRTFRGLLDNRDELVARTDEGYRRATADFSVERYAEDLLDLIGRLI